MIFLNEVLEHVEYDNKAIDECLRVLKKKGKIIVFAPNKGYTFETHGRYIKKKYILGNSHVLS